MGEPLQQAAPCAVAGVMGPAAGVAVSDSARGVGVLIGHRRMPRLDRLAGEVAGETRAALGFGAEGTGSGAGTLVALLRHHAPDADVLTSVVGILGRLEADRPADRRPLFSVLRPPSGWRGRHLHGTPHRRATPDEIFTPSRYTVRGRDSAARSAAGQDAEEASLLRSA